MKQNETSPEYESVYTTQTDIDFEISERRRLARDLSLGRRIYNAFRGAIGLEPYYESGQRPNVVTTRDPKTD